MLKEMDYTNGGGPQVSKLENDIHSVLSWEDFKENCKLSQEDIYRVPNIFCMKF